MIWKCMCVWSSGQTPFPSIFSKWIGEAKCKLEKIILKVEIKHVNEKQFNVVCLLDRFFQLSSASQPAKSRTICPWEYLGRIWMILGQNWIRTNHFKIRGKKKKSFESRHGYTIVLQPKKAANSNDISCQLLSKYIKWTVGLLKE